MESGPKHLRLGDRLDGAIVRQNGGRRFEVRSKAAPSGWKVELHALKPEEIELGTGGSFWVAKVAPLHRSILVHEGDFGRLPISAAMRPRYLSALQQLLSGEEMSAEQLADLQSMVARITTRNHADWLTVWQVLGEPESGDVKQLLAAINAIRVARKTEPQNLAELRERLVEIYGDQLERAVKRLTSLKPRTGV